MRVLGLSPIEYANSAADSTDLRTDSRESNIGIEFYSMIYRRLATARKTQKSRRDFGWDAGGQFSTSARGCCRACSTGCERRCSKASGPHGAAALTDA